MSLTNKEEILKRDTQSGSDQQREGVRFSSPGYLASTVKLNYVRWVDMGSPAKIRVTIEPADAWDPAPPGGFSGTRSDGQFA